MSKEDLYNAARDGDSATVRELAPKLTQADIDWQNPDNVSYAMIVNSYILYS